MKLLQATKLRCSNRTTLLQYEEFDFAYGGLTNAKTGDYRFRYFTDDENGSTWDVDLSKSNIERITMRWSSISAHKTLSAPHFIL